MKPYILATTILAALLILTVILPGCSVAALMQQQSVEQRMTALEGRVHTLEARP